MKEREERTGRRRRYLWALSQAAGSQPDTEQDIKSERKV